MLYERDIARAVRERLRVNLYLGFVIDYLSDRFHIPRDSMYIAIEPRLPLNARPDATIMYNGTLYIIEFRARPDLPRDLTVIEKYVEASKHIGSIKSIPILVYTSRLSREITMMHKLDLKPLIVLYIANGMYNVVYENI